MFQNPFIRSFRERLAPQQQRIYDKQEFMGRVEFVLGNLLTIFSVIGIALIENPWMFVPPALLGIIAVARSNYWLNKSTDTLLH